MTLRRFDVTLQRRQRSENSSPFPQGRGPRPHRSDFGRDEQGESTYSCDLVLVLVVDRVIVNVTAVVTVFGILRVLMIGLFVI